MLALIPENNVMRNLTLFFVTLLAVPSTQAAAASLGTYQALYDLEPARIGTTETSVPLDGRIAYEVRGADCAGWTVASSFATRFADRDKGLQIFRTDANTFESPDGLLLQANQQQLVNTEFQMAARIEAKRPTLGAEAQVTQTGTTKSDFTVGREMLFPAQHQKKLLEAAIAGMTRDTSFLFDGSDGAKQYRVVTFIGKRRPPGSFAPDVEDPQLASLKDLSSWSFQLGYYLVADDKVQPHVLDSAKTDAPEFEANFNMYENGVSTEIMFDYGTYAIKGHIAKFEVLPNEPCVKTGAAASTAQ